MSGFREFQKKKKKKKKKDFVHTTYKNTTNPRFRPGTSLAVILQKDGVRFFFVGFGLGASTTQVEKKEYIDF